MPSEPPQIEVASLTLLTAGFTIRGVIEQAGHAEIRCARISALGVEVPYLVAVRGTGQFTEAGMRAILESARADGDIPVFVAPGSQDGVIAWEEFVSALGGEVPRWEALSDSFGRDLLIASRNRLPDGMSGEAWLRFEDLTRAGLQFVFGRRAYHLGGRKRGRRVSDVQAQTPSGEILCVDAKASEEGFNLTADEERKEAEYARRHISRQTGQFRVHGILLVSSVFQQDSGTLLSRSLVFQVEHQVPLFLMTADELRSMVDDLKQRPTLRNAIRWNRIFQPGRARMDEFRRELQEASEERVSVEP